MEKDLQDTDHDPKQSSDLPHNEDPFGLDETSKE